MYKVMIVEDEPPLQRSLANIIETQNSEFKVISTAFNGQVALDLLKEDLPDVVFTDIRMPVMDGLNLMSHLSEKHPDIIIVVLSGYQEFDYARKSLQYGAFDYILKPVSKPEITCILSKISAMIENKKLHNSSRKAALIENFEEEEKSKAPSIVLQIEKYLKENISEPITNTVLSDRFGLVPSYLSKLFKDYKGISPAEYLTNLRIEKAKKMLESQPGILCKEISIQVGYSDPLYFSRLFKKETGVWPSDYKRK